ncbi:MAG: acyl-CoA/acyl-ACP dehydrogenase [Actinomycetota bacterium]|nr:acyl-CoA/acyl-ACP dehydrogenase [Actinomycetota bacterium]
MSPPYLKALAPIVEEIVAPLAIEIDRDGRPPTEAVEALGEAGLLGLLSATELGGMGEGHRAATLVVQELARHCGSTAMVVLMHYAGAAVVEACGPEPLRRQVAEGAFVTTLAFSETGSRSMFWVPQGTATPSEDGDTLRLDGRKSWVTGASVAHGFVWSSRPARADGMSTLWMVPAGAPGITIGPPFDGMGLRGNDSRPVTAEGAEVPADAMLGPDGGGFDIMLGTVLPYFQVMSAGFSVATAHDSTLKAAAHAGSTRFEHLDQSLAENLVTRSNVARMRIKTDQVDTLLLDTLAALEAATPSGHGAGRQDATLRMLEVKAAAAEMANEVTELALRVCGGTGFKRELGVERHFRDARASTVMAPTTDSLYDFVGRLVCGLPLF